MGKKVSNMFLAYGVNNSHTVGMVRKPDPDHTYAYIHLEDRQNEVRSGLF